MLKINGSVENQYVGKTIAQLLNDKNTALENIVVEHNGKILQRERFVDTFIHNDDQIEIISFVGGG